MSYTVKHPLTIQIHISILFRQKVNTYMNDQNRNRFTYAKTSRYKAVLRFVLTWFLTVAILVILFSRIKFTDVMALVQQTDIRFLGAAVLCSLLAHVVFSSVRYQAVVGAMGCGVSFSEAVLIRMGCNPIKSLLPMKTGELAIIAYMKKRHQLSYPGGFFSLLFGYVFSFVVLILLCSLGGAFYFHDALPGMIYAALFLLILFSITPFSLKQISRLITRMVEKYRIYPETWASFREKYDAGAIKKIILHSAGIEGSKLLIIFFLLKSLRVEIPPDALLFRGSATVLAVYLPVTYWGLGIRESAILFLFAGYAVPEKLLAGSLLITFVDGILPVFLGLFFVKPFLSNLWEEKKEGQDSLSRDA